MVSDDNEPDGPDLGAGHMDRAVELVRFLRVECPWDRKQTPESLVPHLLEEAHEVVDAIRGGHDDELEGELGDLLLLAESHLPVTLIPEERQKLLQ